MDHVTEEKVIGEGVEKENVLATRQRTRIFTADDILRGKEKKTLHLSREARFFSGKGKTFFMRWGLSGS